MHDKREDLPDIDGFSRIKETKSMKRFLKGIKGSTYF